MKKMLTHSEIEKAKNKFNLEFFLDPEAMKGFTPINVHWDLKGQPLEALQKFDKNCYELIEKFVSFLKDKLGAQNIKHPGVYLWQDKSGCFSKNLPLMGKSDIIYIGKATKNIASRQIKAIEYPVDFFKARIAAWLAAQDKFTIWYKKLDSNGVEKMETDLLAAHFAIFGSYPFLNMRIGVQFKVCECFSK